MAPMFLFVPGSRREVCPNARVEPASEFLGLVLDRKPIQMLVEWVDSLVEVLQWAEFEIETDKPDWLLEAEERYADLGYEKQ